MDERLNSLRSYGADVDGSLERFVDDSDLYLYCLDTFMDDREFGMLEQAIAAEDYEAAFMAAHSLKGVSANLGLTPLYNSVCVVVEALRAHSYGNISVLYGAVKAEHERVEKLLRN